MNPTITMRAPAAVTRSGERRTSFFRRIFVDTPEDSVKLRMVTLFASLWAAFSIAFVGGIHSLAIPSGCVRMLSQ